MALQQTPKDREAGETQPHHAAYLLLLQEEFQGGPLRLWSDFGQAYVETCKAAGHQAELLP